MLQPRISQAERARLTRAARMRLAPPDAVPPEAAGASVGRTGATIPPEQHRALTR